MDVVQGLHFLEKARIQLNYIRRLEATLRWRSFRLRQQWQNSLHQRIVSLHGLGERLWEVTQLGRLSGDLRDQRRDSHRGPSLHLSFLAPLHIG